MSGKPTFSEPRPQKREQRGKPALHKCILHHGVDRDSVGLGSSPSEESIGCRWVCRGSVGGLGLLPGRAGLGGGVEWAGEGAQNSLEDK